MAGHSKWNNIKRRKSAQDAKKGKIFTKIGREISVAVKEGGPDPEKNSKLADVVEKAKSYNMPNDNIKRSIEKASDAGNTENFDPITYEGYGPGGVAIIVTALTDNKNRTAANVRHCFTKHGGNLGQTGSVSYLFEDKGEIYVSADEVEDEDELMMSALEAEAEDIENLGDAYLISTTPSEYKSVKKAISEDYEIAQSSVGPVAKTTVDLNEADHEKLQKLIDDLEDDDDVQEVYHNYESKDE